MKVKVPGPFRILLGVNAFPRKVGPSRNKCVVHERLTAFAFHK